MASDGGAAKATVSIASRKPCARAEAAAGLAAGLQAFAAEQAACDAAELAASEAKAYAARGESASRGTRLAARWPLGAVGRPGDDGEVCFSLLVLFVVVVLFFFGGGGGSFLWGKR